MRLRVAKVIGEVATGDINFKTSASINELS